ncbi:hypothetical protein I3843_13G019300 [Carya illinoinensis]|uniref:PIG-P domain-containing protein n=1 Tax=Carya illinoinensis TaxID=32201 RepID=A0A922AG95_CARIL|nr:hypothetical protein I3842_13G020800 [Carya illinoinensis]KAG7948678.1 hypothetical protein I3843_13G019300 [Carya illinoinensis]
MEDPHSVSSPRRTHSPSKKRRVTVSSLDADEKVPGFGVSGEHGPKPSEVYGFVGSITTVVATVIFLAWAYVPEAWLHYIGIFYYPSRYWALAGPVYVMMTIVLALGSYVGFNFMSTPYPTSLNTMFGKPQLAFIISNIFEDLLRFRKFGLCFQSIPLTFILLLYEYYEGNNRIVLALFASIYFNFSFLSFWKCVSFQVCVNLLPLLQMNSVENHRAFLLQWMEMIDQLSPYLILASTKLMISCLTM